MNLTTVLASLADPVRRLAPRIPESSCTIVRKPVTPSAGRRRGPGKYVPPKNGSASGVRNIDSGQPPPRPLPASWLIDVQRRHVDRVDVGPLLAIDLDAHEMLVHEAWRSRRRESSPAPSRGTSGSSNSRSRERSACLPSSPSPGPPSPHGIPIDRVVGVLQKIRAGLLRQAVGVLGRRSVLAGSCRAGEQWDEQ